jgi:hypothetical protein
MLHDSNGNSVMLLLKMGQREHMEQFRKGLLYMYTLSYFRGLDGRVAVGAAGKPHPLPVTLVGGIVHRLRESESSGFIA